MGQSRPLVGLCRMVCLQNETRLACWMLLWICCPFLPIFLGPCGHGEQCHITLPAGDWEDQEPLIPQPNADHEHWEKAGPQDRGEQRTTVHSNTHRPRLSAQGNQRYDQIAGRSIWTRGSSKLLKWSAKKNKAEECWTTINKNSLYTE